MGKKRLPRHPDRELKTAQGDKGAFPASDCLALAPWLFGECQGSFLSLCHLLSSGFSVQTQLPDKECFWDVWGTVFPKKPCCPKLGGEISVLVLLKKEKPGIWEGFTFLIFCGSPKALLSLGGVIFRGTGIPSAHSLPVQVTENFQCGFIFLSNIGSERAWKTPAPGGWRCV